MSAASGPVELFYSYSHKDDALRKELEKHLSILQRQGLIANWHDRRIAPGDEWAGQIDEHLETVQLILLLVSADFLASKYCYDIETMRAMERHEAGEATVIPVILRPVLWKGAPFAKLQALPKDGKPVTDWDNQDKAFQNIAEGIQMTVEAISATRSFGTTAIGPIWYVPYRRNTFFTGRESILDNLRQTLTTDNQAVLGQVIADLGGIGKTQTALEYAYRYRDQYNAVFGVDANTELELTSSFLEIANRLRLKHDPSQPEAAIAAVKH